MPALAIANARLDLTRSRRNLGFATDLWKPHSARARTQRLYLGIYGFSKL
jgi:hypothetical protein